MFGGIKKAWKEARGATLLKEVEGVVFNAHHLPDHTAKEFFLQYRSMITGMTEKFGPIPEIQNEIKLRIHKEIEGRAKALHAINPGKAYATFMVSALLEALTLPGEAAEQVVIHCDNLWDLTGELVDEAQLTSA